MKKLLLSFFAIFIFCAAVAAQGSYFFAPHTPSNIVHSNFYKVNQQYGPGFVEFWLKAKTPNHVGYPVSDGPGGQHVILLGYQSDNVYAYPTGNFFNGQQIISFNARTGFRLGEWAHYAWGYDGQFIRLWLNGIKVYEAPYNGVRMTLEGGSDGNLYIGGSYHNNAGANIARVRILEGFCPYTQDFIPDRTFGKQIKVRDGEFYNATFVADYSAPAESFPDLGTGATRSGGLSPGVLNGYTRETELPVFQLDRVSYAAAGEWSAPPVPDGALAFASFARPNQTYAFQSPTLGQSDGGSLGPLNWDAPFGWGIIGEWAYCFYNSWYTNHLEIGRPNVDVRVTRQNGAGTGLSLRYVDQQNRLVVTGSDTAINATIFVSGTPIYFNFGAPANWRVLRAVVAGNQLQVFADASLIGSVPVPASVNGTKHGLYYGGSINRSRFFTVFPVN